MYDQFVKQESRKAVHSTYNQIRNQLQVQARNLQQLYHSVAKSESPTEIATVLGKIEMYLEVRKSLQPNVAADGYMDELEGCANKLHCLLK